jgi:hypothetical protein
MSDLSDEILALLGEEATVRLAERIGGQRIYIPLKVRDNGVLCKAIGREAAQRLSAQFAPATIRIGVFRDLRARHYRSKGMSARQIATRLCMSQTGVDRMLRRLGAKASKSST